MKYDLTKLEEYGINTEVGIDYTGNYEKYLSTLKHFFNSCESNCKRIQKALDDMDIEDYTIIVHSLKSNTRMIGAGELSGSFEALELAARSGNVSIVINDTPSVLAAYSLLAEQLKPIAAEDSNETCDEILGVEDALKITKELLDALDDYDDERSAALIKKLRCYPFEADQNDMLIKAAGYISEFMYDEAADIIKKISTSINQVSLPASRYS